jgi:WNK lysine deficient protein kinase
MVITSIKISSLDCTNLHLYHATDAAFLFFWPCTGKCKNIEFAFDLENDTSLSVATEMVQELELPSWSMPIVAKLVDAFLLKTVRGWRPCVQVGQMIQAVQNTASANGKCI